MLSGCLTTTVCSKLPPSSPFIFLVLSLGERDVFERVDEMATHSPTIFPNRVPDISHGIHFLPPSQGKGDVFELADKILESWYPTLEVGDKRGVVLLVTSQKEGAVAGGPTFLNAVGDDLLEAVVSENLPGEDEDSVYSIL